MSEQDPQWIDEKTYRKRIAMREPYRVAIKEHPNEQGTWRAQRPAVGGSARVLCPLREPKANVQGRHLLPVFPQTVSATGEVPAYCQQKTVTFNGLIFPKSEQKYVFESEEWSRIYRSLRGTVESFNNSAKRGSGAAKLGGGFHHASSPWVDCSLFGCPGGGCFGECCKNFCLVKAGPSYICPGWDTVGEA